MSTSRRLRSDQVDSAVAERVAKIFARAEQRMLDSQRQYSAEWVTGKQHTIW